MDKKEPKGYYLGLHAVGGEATECKMRHRFKLTRTGKIEEGGKYVLDSGVLCLVVDFCGC